MSDFIAMITQRVAASLLHQLCENYHQFAPREYNSIEKGNSAFHLDRFLPLGISPSASQRAARECDAPRAAVCSQTHSTMAEIHDRNKLHLQSNFSHELLVRALTQYEIIVTRASKLVTLHVNGI